MKTFRLEADCMGHRIHTFIEAASKEEAQGIGELMLPPGSKWALISTTEVTPEQRASEEIADLFGAFFGDHAQGKQGQGQYATV
jgi:hypothetical protein